MAFEVEDLVNSNMIDVCADGRERSTDAMQAYLYSRSVNATVSRIRKVGAQRRYWSRNRCLIDDADDEITDFEEQQHRESTVARLLEELPDGKRVLLKERYFDGLEYEEMAARRGKRPDAVRKATSRAREALRDLMAASCR